MADDAAAAGSGEVPAVPPGEVPGESQFATVNGVRLHYVVAGPEDGPLVLLLHGFPEFWYAWRRQIPALAEAGFRVVAPDLRGYNRSGKPRRVRDYHVDELVADVVGLVRALGRETASLVGHDWGGGIAWQVAIEHPDLVERLVVLNAPHPSAFQRELTRSPDQLARMWYVGFFQLPWLPERLLTGSIEGAFRGASAPDAFTETDVERYRRAFDRPGAARAAVNYYRALVREGVRMTLLGEDPEGDVLVPTLVIWGEQDRALNPTLLDGLDTWVPDLRIERLPDASHWVQHDEPERVTDSLLGFLG